MAVDFGYRISSAVGKVRSQCKAERLAQSELAQEVESGEALIARIRGCKVVPSVNIPDEAIDSLSIRQLKALASERKVPRYSRLNKAGLVAALA